MADIPASATAAAVAALRPAAGQRTSWRGCGARPLVQRRRPDACWGIVAMMLSAEASGSAASSNATSASWRAGRGAPTNRRLSDTDTPYRLLSGSQEAFWLKAMDVPALHAAGLRGTGQVVGIGDTGVNVASCSFADAAAAVPYDSVGSGHRKVAAYFTKYGDRGDGPHGHGTHIAGTIAGDDPGTASGSHQKGVAPAARLAVVDFEFSLAPGEYNVPDTDIASYFNLIVAAGAQVTCSPWSFDDNPQLEQHIDQYATDNLEFLPVFPSGNGLDGRVHAPCTAKNVLCVGASYNTREAYIERPTFARTSLQVGSYGCLSGTSVSPGSPAALAECAAEVRARTALFGPTAPPAQNAVECLSVISDCIYSGSPCPQCAYPRSALGLVHNAPVVAAQPADACTSLVGFTQGAACLVQRGGGCSFASKVRRCQLAGAAGAIIVDTPGSVEEIVMSGDAAGSLNPAIPAIIISSEDSAQLNFYGARVSFPLVGKRVSPHKRAPFSGYGRSGILKPEIVLPGDGIQSTMAADACGMSSMTGTSQSCGVAAGVVGLLREFLQTRAHPGFARLTKPAASTLRAALIALARLDEVGATVIGLEGPPVVRQDIGFGLPVLSSLLHGGHDAPGESSSAFVLQSMADAASPQTFCFEIGAAESPQHNVPAIAIVWTDPVGVAGTLVHDLDLAVQCGDSRGLTSKRYGNGGPQADYLNSVEKASLAGMRTGGLCVASVSAPKVTRAMPQKFSLVAAGGQLLPRPDCAATSQAAAAAALSCVHGTLGDVSGTQAKFGCICEEGWLGPLCDQAPEDVGAPLAVQHSAQHSGLGVADMLERRWLVRPWQWKFFAAFTCGPGVYEAVVEELVPRQSAEYYQPLHVAATVLPAGVGRSALWLSDPNRTAVWSASPGPASWSEAAGGVLFNVSTVSAGDLRRLILKVEILADSGVDAGTQLFLGVYCRDREGSGGSPATAFGLKWQLVGGSKPGSTCTAAASSLRGGASAGQLAAGSSVLPTVLAFLGAFFGVVAVIGAGFFLADRWLRQRSKVLIEPTAADGDPDGGDDYAGDASQQLAADASWTLPAPPVLSPQGMSHAMSGHAPFAYEAHHFAMLGAPPAPPSRKPPSPSNGKASSLGGAAAIAAAHRDFFK
eukprot:TRINITY_DN34844_c0_g2_i1.p1 TRINITY_DN34844_c0_g2~~TRINITY_DN34844_c0_g2_i1.p1  ORF type:complete len:1136 (+),score=192.87 TRINITY_DN34844_c0_g2_i1:97-3504(+)